MNSVEERIRGAAEAIARAIPEGSAPALRAPAGPGQPATPHRARTLHGPAGRRVLAPLAAAAAVAAIVVTSVLAGTGGPGSNRAVGPGQALRQVPRYYMTLVMHGRLQYPPQYAVLRNAATGALVATVRPPSPFGTFTAVAAAADDQTFVLAAQPRLPAQPGMGPTKFYGARFSPADGKVQLSPLPIPTLPAHIRWSDLALSPDGTRLAVAIPLGSTGLQISVYSTTTGRSTVWRDHGLRNSHSDNAYSPVLCWTRGGRLAFTDWFSGQRQGIWLLNTTLPGSSLLADSRFAIPSAQPGHWSLTTGPILSPDGTTIIASMGRNSPNGITDEFQVFSATTGRELRALWPLHLGSGLLVWSNPSGTVLVAVASERVGLSSSRAPYLGVLSGNRFTPIPRAPTPGMFGPLPVAF